MHVGTVSAVIRIAFKAMKNMEFNHEEDREAMATRLDDPASSVPETQRVNPPVSKTSLAQLHFQSFRLRRSECFDQSMLDSVIVKKLEDSGYGFPNRVSRYTGR